MAKLAPGDLAQVLGKLPKQENKDVIVGFDTADDAGVVRLSDELALVQTVDFFTPVCDDPFTYGRVAAVNALNDVYAMGGIPITALSIVGFPQSGDFDVLGEILAGGQAALNEEGVTVIGGHSIDDKEIKFGYAITGTIHPGRVVKNSTAREGDLLVLTKPLGTGVISTGIKFGKAPAEAITASLKAQTTSARIASQMMTGLDASACTDITGFGLLGHSFEMAKASGKTLEIESSSVPTLPSVFDLIEQKMLTRGDRNNRTYIGDEIKFASSVSSIMQSLLFDPQTAGGLLIALSPSDAEKIIEMLDDARIVGRVTSRSEKLLDIR